jgi:hypothetical protein
MWLRSLLRREAEARKESPMVRPILRSLVDGVGRASFGFSFRIFRNVEIAGTVCRGIDSSMI